MRDAKIEMPVNPHDRYGVLLTTTGLAELSEGLRAYLQRGPIGAYLYAMEVKQHGSFLLVTIHPDQVHHRIACVMVLWLPLVWVKLVMHSEEPKELGFRTPPEPPAPPANPPE